MATTVRMQAPEGYPENVVLGQSTPSGQSYVLDSNLQIDANSMDVGMLAGLGFVPAGSLYLQPADLPLVGTELVTLVQDGLVRQTTVSELGSGGGGEAIPGPPGPTAVSEDDGNLAVLGSDELLLVPHTSVLMGVTDGSEALPGQVGEYKVESNVVGVTLPSNVPTQVCPINLKAGDWELWGAVDFLPASGVSPNMVAASISIHPDALPTDEDLMTGVGILNMITTSALSTGQRQMLMTGQCRSNSSDPLDLYLVAQTTLPGTGILTAKGYICARRVSHIKYEGAEDTEVAEVAVAAKRKEPVARSRRRR